MPDRRFGAAFRRRLHDPQQNVQPFSVQTDNTRENPIVPITIDANNRISTIESSLDRLEGRPALYRLGRDDAPKSHIAPENAKKPGRCYSFAFFLRRRDES